jgi:endonuclease-8
VRARRFAVHGGSLRVALHTNSKSALLYSASDIEVLDAAALEAHPFLRRLGPDILDPALTWQAIALRLNGPRFRGRSLASLYLDQSFLAGIGNYLRSETLYFAGIAYRRRDVDMSRADRERLARQTLAVARRSYRTRGVTNPFARVRNRKAAGDTSRSAHRFAVFARDDQPCDACGETIRHAEAGSRRIYFCPGCQV